MGTIGDFAIGLGVLLAIIGPFLLIPLTWLLYRWVVRPLAFRSLAAKTSEQSAKWVCVGSTVLIVFLVLVASYLPGNREFSRLCAEHGTPVVTERVLADGFYRDRMFLYEAGPYLADGFTFVEAPDMYKDGVHLRYSKGGDGTTRQEEIEELQSVYGVRITFSELPRGITMTEKVVYERESGHELARAASIHYRGGPLGLFLGTLGSNSCPNIISEEGSEHFRIFYDLETFTLRAGAPATQE